MSTKEYIFRTHSNHIIKIEFNENYSIQDAIDFFTQNPYNFSSVRIYPLYNVVPNYTPVDSKILLSSFNTNVFLICARFHRNSLKLLSLPQISIEEFMDTPIPISKFGEKEKKKSILINDAKNTLNDNPQIFDSILEMIHNEETDQRVYNTMKAYQERILYLIHNHS